ncbi:MAG: SRPBCC family protein [Proteobacteria bacterium]|nr:SRPBCC family protein [Pseudomonadota bacterium]
MTDRIEKTIELSAPIERVWHAVTDHEQFGTWFRVALDGPFAMGEVTTGRITFEGYEHMKWRSTVERMDEPHLFAFRWPHPNDPTDDHELATAPTTLVEFHLEKIPSGTRLTIIESGFDSIPADRRTTALRENDEGWSLQAKHIAVHVQA